MENEKILHFIAEKIADVKEAILYCHSNYPLRLHNNIIRASKVDNAGFITFFISRPQQLISQFEQEFPVGLNYFRKGKNYFFNVVGKARIIDDPEELAYETELSSDEVNLALTTHIFIKVKILKVDFYDKNFEKKNLFIKKVSSTFYRLFDSFGAASGSYDLSPQSSLHNFGF